MKKILLIIYLVMVVALEGCAIRNNLIRRSNESLDNIFGKGQYEVLAVSKSEIVGYTKYSIISKEDGSLLDVFLNENGDIVRVIPKGE